MPPTPAITLNGRRFDSGDVRVPNLLGLLSSRSTCIDDYRPLLQGMARNGEYEVLAELLLEGECRHALEHGTAMVQGDGEIVLCRDECKTVLISPAHRFTRVPGRAGDASAATIDAYANDMLFVVLGDGMVVLDHFRVVEGQPGARPSIEPSGRHRYGSQDSFALRAGCDAIDIVSVHGQPWVLQLVPSVHQDVARHFDRSSGALSHVSSANFHASRIEFVFDLFRRFGYSGAADTVASIHAGSRFHFVRWKAVQTMLNIDFKRGLSLLREAAGDPHPQVRTAAERTLANLSRYPAAGPAAQHQEA